MDIELEVTLQSEAMREKGMAQHRLTLSNTSHLYWTTAQMVAHHASGRCNLNPGDVFGTGTISAPVREGYGSMGELTDTGSQPLTLPTGEKRGYLEDGDEVALRAHARRQGFVSIGFGESRGRVIPAN